MQRAQASQCWRRTSCRILDCTWQRSKPKVSPMVSHQRAVAFSMQHRAPRHRVSPHDFHSWSYPQSMRTDTHCRADESPVKFDRSPRRTVESCWGRSCSWGWRLKCSRPGWQSPVGLKLDVEGMKSLQLCDIHDFLTFGGVGRRLDTAACCEAHEWAQHDEFEEFSFHFNWYFWSEWSVWGEWRETELANRQKNRDLRRLKMLASSG